MIKMIIESKIKSIQVNHFSIIFFFRDLIFLKFNFLNKDSKML